MALLVVLAEAVAHHTEVVVDTQAVDTEVVSDNFFTKKAFTFECQNLLAELLLLVGA